MNSENVEIKSRDFWFKVVGFLQQNWALVDEEECGECTIYFLNDAGGIFDQMKFKSVVSAEDGLRRNGFNKYAEDKKVQGFIATPSPHFSITSHPNGSIYSSGKFWI